MSSYVINKREFMKAAGVVAALNEKSNFGGIESGLYIGKWSDDGMQWKLLNKEDFIEMFSNFYRLNAYSVMKQYNDKEPETDNGSYIDEFNYYYDLTTYFIKRCDHSQLERIIYGLLMFSNSINYQVEDKEANEGIFKELNKIIVKAFDIIAAHKFDSIRCNYWGEFNYVSDEVQAIEEKKQAEINESYYRAYCD